jgi:uncharacterized membrane protein YcaP (DUF421 family)
MDIVLRATVIFFVLFLLVRVMGKRELAQLTPFELIVLIVMGDLVQQGVTHNDFSVTGAILAVTTMGFWAIAISLLSFHSRRAESFFDGEPRVVVHDGKVVQENLRRDRLTRAEILSEMRLSGIRQLSDVEWAILEPRGKMSFIQRPGASAGAPKSKADEESAAA